MCPIAKGMAYPACRKICSDELISPKETGRGHNETVGAEWWRVSVLKLSQREENNAFS